MGMWLYAVLSWTLLNTNSPPCDGSARAACCLYVLTNVCVPTEGSERAPKEEASDEDEDTEYFDAMEDSPAFITVTATENTQHRSVSHRDPCGLWSIVLCFYVFFER